MWHSSDEVKLFLFLFFFYGAFTVHLNMHLVEVCVTEGQKRARSVWKQRRGAGRNRSIVGYIHWFQGFYFSCSTVSSSVMSMHFRSCNVWPAVEKGLIRGCIVIYFFFFVAFTSQGEKLSSYREMLSPLKVSFIFVNQNGFYCFHWNVCCCTFLAQCVT